MGRMRRVWRSDPRNESGPPVIRYRHAAYAIAATIVVAMLAMRLPVRAASISGGGSTIQGESVSSGPPAANDMLQYSGTQWTNVINPTLGGSMTIPSNSAAAPPPTSLLMSNSNANGQTSLEYDFSSTYASRLRADYAGNIFADTSGTSYGFGVDTATTSGGIGNLDFNVNGTAATFAVPIAGSPAATLGATGATSLNINSTGAMHADPEMYFGANAGVAPAAPINTIYASMPVISAVYADKYSFAWSGFAGCTNYPSFVLEDITASLVLGAITVSSTASYGSFAASNPAVAAGHILQVSIVSAPAGCTMGNFAAYFALGIEYHMQ